MEKIKMRLEKWVNEKIKIILFYRGADGKFRKIVGKITSFDNNFLFVVDEKYENEFCINLNSVNKIERFKDLKNEN